MFVDGAAYFSSDSIETDAPIPAGSLIYEALDSSIVGTKDGETFAFVFDGSTWNAVDVKPVTEWTDADWTAWEAGHPVGQFDAVEDATAEEAAFDFSVPDISDPFQPLTIDMGVLALSGGLISA